MKGTKMEDNKYDKIVNYVIENQDKFYRLVFTYVKNREDALDVIQNAICKALENYHSIRNIEYVKTWFYRILVNESINYIKKNKKNLFYEGEEEKIVYIESGYEEGLNLYDKVNKLPLDVQHIIKLRFYEEMSLKEISEIMKLNLNTVKAKLYRGLKALKQEVQEVDE